MKRLYTLMTSTVLLLATEALCSTALITVELPSMENKKAWHQLDIPTYEFIGNTAIAEVEESRVGSLKQKGYLVEIIDKQPETSKCMVISKTVKAQASKEKPIWQNDQVAIIKPLSRGHNLDPEYKHITRPMNIRPLGDRFWKSVTTKYVTLKSIPYDPFIQSLVDQVNADSIASYIDKLQSYETRYILTDGARNASEWVYNKFSSWGYQAELDSVYLNTWLQGWCRSPIGTIQGSSAKTIIACGHLDSGYDTVGWFPGADDNASGTAGTMEIARLFSKYSWESTMKFACWTGEEFYGIGSNHFATQADSQDMDITGVVNMDMIGYMSDSVMNGEVWHYSDGSSWLVNLFMEVRGMYVPSMQYNSLNSGERCDNYYFENAGYSAITTIEPDPRSYPYYHTAHDSLCYLTPAMFKAFTQTALATIAVMDNWPATVESVKVLDMGNGSQLAVSWKENTESDIVGYRVYWGKRSSVYSDSAIVAMSGYIIAGLAADTLYYICVRALDNKGNLSYRAVENTGTPRVAPLAPSGMTQIPLIMSVGLSWRKNSEIDMAGYRLYRKIDQGGWDSLNTTLLTDTAFTDSVPYSESKYWYCLRAYDSAGNASTLSDSIYVYTYAIMEFYAKPIPNGIRLEWMGDSNMSISGYRLYREIGQSSWDSLNSNLMSDTSYIDSSLSGANKYYYRVRAFDDMGKPSRLSDSAYARPITLDQGVLLMDETNNWTTGSFPRDAQQDSFYNYIFSGYKYEPYEYGTTLQKPILADLGPYSTVAWLADDYAGMLASGAVNDLKSYLDAGGKLWFAGWKPSGNIHNTSTYPADYATGDISYDNFRSTRSELSGAADSFKTAIGLKGYPDIAIDTLKYPASTIWGKTFRSIEALTPLAGADTIYVMDMKNNGSAYEGKACAVRDSGKTVFFGFPLYFMDKEQARAAAQKIMAEFGEPYTGVEGQPDNRERIKETRLFQNAPNPFRRSTNINYQLTKTGLATLKVYNIQGQLVRTLVNGVQQAGSYMVKWDRQDSRNKQVSAGVYIYHLSVGDQTQSRKMIILK